MMEYELIVVLHQHVDVIKWKYTILIFSLPMLDYPTCILIVKRIMYEVKV